jgi:16S rRNA (guanine527-N7)-methyltransferase
VFGERLPLASRYAKLLAGPGLDHGLLGPRELPRLWTRHLLNSAVLGELVPSGVRLLDVGSGAGLPGLPLAISRPDLRVVLLEPMLRRSQFLVDAVSQLGLEAQVSVVRGRAGEPVSGITPSEWDWIVARAVAPLDRLVRWTAPLLSPGGRLLAMKGATAHDEVAQHRAALAGLGVDDVQVAEVGASSTDPTWVVSVRRAVGGPVGEEKGRQ